jgi:hypothetical protein
VVAKEASLPFGRDIAADFEITERVTGSGATDFGVPEKPASGDATPLAREEALRLAELVAASWRVFERVVKRAPAVLAKGPRGGGRDRDEIAAHIVGPEAGYARQIRIRRKPPEWGDTAAIEDLRSAVLDALRGSHDAAAVAEWRWSPRYAARRFAWHVLDHTWEIEDKGGIEPERAWS